MVLGLHKVLLDHIFCTIQRGVPVGDSLPCYVPCKELSSMHKGLLWAAHLCTEALNDALMLIKKCMNV